MTLRLNILPAAFLLAVIFLSAGNAFATCASIGSAANKTNDIAQGVTEKVTNLETTTKQRLQTASDNFVSAQTAFATNATQNTQSLAKSIAGFEDASNQQKLTLMKSKEAFVTARDMKPTIAECIALTSKKYSGLEMQYLTEAATKRMDRDSINDFTNDEKSPYSKGVTSAMGMYFIEYLQYYCKPEANNGKMPSQSKPIRYNGTDYYCGSGRSSLSSADAASLVDADINVGDIMFGDKTWPNNGTSSMLGDKIYAASQKMNRYLNVSPRDPFNPSALETSGGIQDFVERRAFEARASMAETQFHYISAKRAPTAKDGGIWMREMIAKELAKEPAQASETGMDAYCRNAFSNGTVRTGYESCGMWANAKKIPDTASKNEMMNFIMMDRFLGSDFALQNANNTVAASQKLQIHLLTLDLIQQREINEIIERILGTTAAKYALSVDREARSSSIGSAK